MMVLRSFPEGFGCPSLSPFCVKAMHLLTASGVDWTVDFQSDPRKAPKGKFPVLVDGDVIVADTWAIRAHLLNRTGADLDAGLSVRERAQGTALARLAGIGLKINRPIHAAGRQQMHRLDAKRAQRRAPKSFWKTPQYHHLAFPPALM